MKYIYLFFVVLLEINCVGAMERDALVRHLQESNQLLRELHVVCSALEQDSHKMRAMLVRLRGLVRAQVPSRNEL